ncbi:hypothetical protein EES43_17160 [Streptomyces sp. ADI96-02]|nr:hypothetical protein EES43_17160 [Streptomyces sp. ADI96-02]
MTNIHGLPLDEAEFSKAWGGNTRVALDDLRDRGRPR